MEVRVVKVKLSEIMQESMIDTIKQKLGTIKGKIVSSVNNMLSILKSNPFARLTTIEKFEAVNYGTYESRVDTGAFGCSIDASDIKIEEDNKIVTFKHGGKSYREPLLRVKEVKNANATVDRPRVEIDFKWNGKIYPKIETSLADRSKLKFKLLIGRNLIKKLKRPVHLNDKETLE